MRRGDCISFSKIAESLQLLYSHLEDFEFMLYL